MPVLSNEQRIKDRFKVASFLSSRRLIAVKCGNSYSLSREDKE